MFLIPRMNHRSIAIWFLVATAPLRKDDEWGSKSLPNKKNLDSPTRWSRTALRTLSVKIVFLQVSGFISGIKLLPNSAAFGNGEERKKKGYVKETEMFLPLQTSALKKQNTIVWWFPSKHGTSNDIKQKSFYVNYTCLRKDWILDITATSHWVNRADDGQHGTRRWQHTLRSIFWAWGWYWCWAAWRHWFTASSIESLIMARQSLAWVLLS